MSDKRQVTTDALETLGTIINESDIGKRDAIHLAVQSAVAAHTLRPGEDVGFVEGGVGLCQKPVGIVDPFLRSPVQKGDRFWLIVYPRKITSLRHVWEHPDFAASDAVKTAAMSDSEVWLRHYASNIPVHYEHLLERAADYVENGEYWCEGGRFEGEYVPDEFWRHYQNVTGKTVPEIKQGSFFSCAC